MHGLRMRRLLVFWVLCFIVSGGFGCSFVMFVAWFGCLLCFYLCLVCFCWLWWFVMVGLLVFADCVLCVIACVCG